MEIKQKGTLFIFILRWEWRQAFAAVFSVHCQERRVHPILALSVILITWMPFASIGHLHILYTVQVHAALGQLWLYCELHINSLARTFMLDWRSRAHCPMRPLYVKKRTFCPQTSTQCMINQQPEKTRVASIPDHLNWETSCSHFRRSDHSTHV